MTTSLDSLLKADVNAIAKDISNATVVIAGIVIPGILHIRGVDWGANLGIGGISGDEMFVAVPTSALPPGLANGATTLTINGKPYMLRDTRKEADSDGELTFLFVEAVQS